MFAKRQIISGLCLLAGIGLAVYSDFLRVRAFPPARDLTVRPGRELPHLPVVDSRGNPEDLGNASPGGKRIIVFFSPACDTCRTVLPELHSIPREIRLLLVDVGEENSSESPEILGLPGTELFRDPHGTFRRAFSVPILPTILFVDERGILLDGLVGAHALGLVQNKVRELSARR
jgi:hypothetical protein